MQTDGFAVFLGFLDNLGYRIWHKHLKSYLDRRTTCIRMKEIREKEQEKTDDLNQTSSCVTRGGEPVRNMNLEGARWSTDVMT